MTRKPPPHDDVTVRRAEPRDSEAIRRVAERDTKLAPSGPTLVAEVGGSILAVRPLDGGEAVADPFHPTRDLLDLLELRAAQIASLGQEKGRGVAALWLSRQFLAGRSRSTQGVARPGLAGR
jgi:hypothetical protein